MGQQHRCRPGCYEYTYFLVNRLLFGDFLLELVGFVERRVFVALHRHHLLLDGVERVRRHLSSSGLGLWTTGTQVKEKRKATETDDDDDRDVSCRRWTEKQQRRSSCSSCICSSSCTLRIADAGAMLNLQASGPACRCSRRSSVAHGRRQQLRYLHHLAPGGCRVYANRRRVQRIVQPMGNAAV